LDEIARLRARIDEIDQDILGLLKNRYENARQLGHLKQAQERKIRDPKREKAILQRVGASANKLGLNPNYTTKIFSEIFRLSIEAQAGTGEVESDELHGKTALVIGAGGMGRFFTSLMRAHGATVRIVGRNSRKTRKAAREMAVEPGTIKDAAVSDITIVSVPIHVTKQISVNVASHMRRGTLLMDLSSIKSGVANKIFANIPDKVEYVSIHPLFGPNIDSLSGQNLAAVLYHAGTQWRAFAKAIRRDGGRIHFVTADAHDRAMARVQVLHHFALLCLARSLADWNGELVTNSLKTTTATLRRLSKNWDTVESIQRLNPHAQEQRRLFLRTVRSMMDWPSKSAATKGGLPSCVQKWSRKL
jgi:chorismate mutase / prephenate dehydrogenase